MQQHTRGTSHTCEWKRREEEESGREWKRVDMSGWTAATYICVEEAVEEHDVNSIITQPRLKRDASKCLELITASMTCLVTL
jgi:hypothetical protein